MPSKGAVGLKPDEAVGAHIAQIRVPGRAPATASARRQEGGHHVIADFKFPHSGTDFDDDTGALVAADDGNRGGQVPGSDVVVGVAQSGGLERHQDFAVFRRIEIDLFDAPILFVVPQDGGIHLHQVSPNGRGASLVSIGRLRRYRARTARSAVAG